MKDGSAPYWFPAVTLILGALGGYFADYLREGRGARRARQLASDAFERDTLIALQDALARAGEATLAIHQFDEQLYRHTGRWGRDLLPDELRNAFAVAANDVTRNRVRVRDDGIRETAHSYAAWCVVAQTGATGDNDDDEVRRRATEARDGLSEMLHDLNEEIGERLRVFL